MRRVFNVIELNTFAAKTQATLETAPLHLIVSIEKAWVQAIRSDVPRTRHMLLCHLTQTTQDLAANYPNDPNVALWNGIVLVAYSRAVGGVCALNMLIEARTSFERAIELAPQNGAAYLHLGLLYERAPIAPYCFGDERKAKELLEKGLCLTLQTNPLNKYN